MQRLTITIDDDLVVEINRFIAARGYANRSEAFRDLARSGLQNFSTEAAQRSLTKQQRVCEKESRWISRNCNTKP